MSEDHYGGVKLSADELNALIEDNYAWSVDDGVLICMGIKPKTYDWENCGGNDLPIRLRADCLVAIQRGTLQEILNPAGQKVVLRHDLIHFCYGILPDVCEETFRSYAAYRVKKDAARSASLLRPLTEMRALADKEFAEEYVREYQKNPAVFDLMSRRLNKSAIVTRITKRNDFLEEHASTVRDVGKKYTPAWAKHALKTGNMTPPADKLPVKRQSSDSKKKK